MKNVIVGVCFLLTVNIVNAQQLSLGVHGGVGVVSLRGNEVLQQYQQADLRLHGGVAFRLTWKKNMFLITGLNYESKGTSHDRVIMTDELGNDLGYAKPTSKINYLVLPVRAGKEFGSNIRFNVQLGVFGGLLLIEKFIADFEEDRESIVRENDSQYRKVDFGISAGLGLNFPAGKKWRAGFEITNDLGLVDISTMPVIGNGTIKTNALNLRTGLFRQL